MKNYLPKITETQKQELKRRIALELYIENFTAEDFLVCFTKISQERLSKLALSLSEEADNLLPQRALDKYGSLAEAILNEEAEAKGKHYIQIAQVLADFGQQHKLV